MRLLSPDPLESLIMQVPPLDENLFTSKADAGVTLLKAIRKKLLSSPRALQVNQSVEIARPFARDMKLLTPSLNRKFNQYVPFKVSFTLKVFVVTVSTVLQLVFMYIYDRVNQRDRIFPKSLKKYSTIKPVLQVPNKCSKKFSTKFFKRNHLLGPDAIEITRKLPTVPHEHINSDHDLQAAPSFSPAASIPTYQNGTRIFVTATALQQEGHYDTMEKKQRTPT